MKKFEKNVIIISLIAIIVVFAIWFAFRQTRDPFATKFHSKQSDLKAVSEEDVEKAIGEYCENRRKEETKLTTVEEAVEAVKMGTGRLEFVGVSETGGNLLPAEAKLVETGADYVLLDIGGKDVKLECFFFDKRVIVQGDGKIEIAYSDFKNISGNALALLGGSGSVHHNRIIGADKAGVFGELGEFGVFSNIIKNNLSYGVYGGVEASLELRENFIANNGGYEVRLLKSGEVWE